MLGILFGIVILVLLVVGLTRRKRSNRAWVKEERYEETGHWIDKRPGERGTWGSLDAEMSRDRQQLVRQGRIVELAELLRQYAAAHTPGFADRSEEQIRAFRAYTRAEAGKMVAGMEQIGQGQAAPEVEPVGQTPHGALKKQILDFAYRQYPALLELDIDTLRAFDAVVGDWAETVMGRSPGS